MNGMNVQVQVIRLRMELDTGSAVTVIQHKLYEQLFTHVPLNKTNLRLQTYTKEKISPGGVLSVKVKLNHPFNSNLKLYEIERGSAPLFGRDIHLKEVSRIIPRRSRFAEGY